MSHTSATSRAETDPASSQLEGSGVRASAACSSANPSDAKISPLPAGYQPRPPGESRAALAADPNVHAKAGQVLASWTLMREYGFRDEDGRQPDWGGFFDGVVDEAMLLLLSAVLLSVLLLSDDATINTKPQLEIFADDVKCTHGATIGQLDAKTGTPVEGPAGVLNLAAGVMDKFGGSYAMNTAPATSQAMVDGFAKPPSPPAVESP